VTGHMPLYAPPGVTVQVSSCYWLLQELLQFTSEGIR